MKDEQNILVIKNPIWKTLPYLNVILMIWINLSQLELNNITYKIKSHHITFFSENVFIIPAALWTITLSVALEGRVRISNSRASQSTIWMDRLLFFWKNVYYNDFVLTIDIFYQFTMDQIESRPNSCTTKNFHREVTPGHKTRCYSGSITVPTD